MSTVVKKFIPNDYKYNDVESRLEILRGLMDTDGSTKDTRATFHNQTKQLCEDVAEIVRSLGGVARIDTQTFYDKPNYYHVRINMPDNPFSLPRKKEAYSPTRPPNKVLSVY